MAIILTRIGGGAFSHNSNLLITNESVYGNKNNNNTIFYTIRNYVIGSLLVYYNGQRLVINSDYKEQNGNSFRLIYLKPYSDDNLVVDYQLST